MTYDAILKEVSPVWMRRRAPQFVFSNANSCTELELPFAAIRNQETLAR